MRGWSRRWHGIDMGAVVDMIVVVVVVVVLFDMGNDFAVVRVVVATDLVDKMSSHKWRMYLQHLLLLLLQNKLVLFYFVVILAIVTIVGAGRL